MEYVESFIKKVAYWVKKQFVKFAHVITPKGVTLKSVTMNLL